jgi:hypothetical protein
MVFGQGSFSPQAGQYSLTGSLTGDQVHPQAAIGPSGGYVVWQDNSADGSGWGISAQRLNNNLSGSLAPFRVNQAGASDQENPRVALTADGGAVFVWQGGAHGSQRIFARFVSAGGTFSTGDIQVNTYSLNEQITPAVARLSDNNIIVIWSSFGQDGHMQGIFGQILSPSGQKVGDEFQVNQTTSYNQRSPVVAALSGGGFVVSWVTESYRGSDPVVAGGEVYNVDIFARAYDASFAAVANEFKVNTDTRGCANPSVAGLATGGFTVAWSQRGTLIRDRSVAATENGWDVFARTFGADRVAASSATRVNSESYGDQYAPRVAAIGNDQMVVWTSLGQDVSLGGDRLRPGIYGVYLSGSGAPVGAEFKVNTTVLAPAAGRGLAPVVVSDGVSRFLAVWHCYAPGTGRVDIFAQRYASTQPLPQLPAPFVAALSQSRIAVSWSALAGYSVASYGLYVDGSATPIETANNIYVVSGFGPGTTHTFRVDYLLNDGRRSTPSDAATCVTWGEDLNFDGLPDDWQRLYWGPDPANWPGAGADSDGDGAVNSQEFLAGTNPTDSGSVLRADIYSTSQGWRLGWNTKAGVLYQIQISTNSTTWSNLGSTRFAPGASDSISVAPSGRSSIYRVLQLR